MVISTLPRRAAGYAAALAVHAILLAVLVTLARIDGVPAVVGMIDHGRQALIWRPDPGSGRGGGGGGGGNDHKDPSRRLERVGDSSDSVPSATPTPTTPRPSIAPELTPPDPILITTSPLGDAIESLPGHIGAPDTNSPSRGPGRGGGAGNHIGDGDGDGRLDGVGGGERAGCCAGLYYPGNGVIRPAVIHAESPRYTNDAMRARIEGVVTLECVVRPNGACSDIRVVRSLDRAFGLDAEAERAAAQWRFKPGTRFGEPVPVVIRIELTFTLR